MNEVQVLFKEKQKDHQGLGLIAKNYCSFKDKGKMHMKYQIYLYLLVWFTIFIEEYAFVIEIESTLILIRSVLLTQISILIIKKYFKISKSKF